MTLGPRELRITHGATTYGYDTSSYLLDGKFTLNKTYEEATISIDIIAIGDTAANFQSACTNLEANWRTPRQLVKVEFVDPVSGANVHETWDPASNTGFDTEPRIVKAGSDTDTARSRRYTVSATVRLPADLTGQNGRQSSTVNLMKTDSNRRRFQVTGTYTALGANSARAQYEASIDAYCSTLSSAFGGNWEGPFDEQASSNDSNKTLNFSRIYEEIIYNQSVGTLDDTTLRRQRLSLTDLTEAPGDTQLAGFSNSVTRLRTVAVEYSVAVDKTVTQDLRSTYVSKIKPHLVNTVRSLTSATALAVTSSEPRFDPVENRVDVTMTCLVAGAGTLLQCNIRTDDTEDTGKDFVPVWNGNPFAAHVFQGPATLTRAVTIVTTALKGSALDRPDPFRDEWGTAAPTPASGGGDLRAHLIGRTSSFLERTMGGRDGDPQLEIVDRTTVLRFRYAADPKTPSAGGGGTPTRTPTGLGGGTPTGGGGSATSTNPSAGVTNVPRTATGGGDAAAAAAALGSGLVSSNGLGSISLVNSPRTSNQ